MKRNRLTILIVLTALLLLAPVVRLALWAVPYDIESSRESVRLRNSLIASVGTAEDFSWTPEAIPQGFLVESGPIPDELSRAATGLMDALPADASNFDKALAIAGHMRSHKGRSDPIVSSTTETYRRIIQDGDGFCSDYTQVFNGLALASGIPVREWGAAFDGYGGQGHAFNEFYDFTLAKWVFIDAFGSFYVRDAKTESPLSGQEFRDYLLKFDTYEQARPFIELVPIVEANLGFQSLDGAYAYYRRGADQFYLYWGNNVFAYDTHPLINLASKVSRSAEQVVGILVGLHPDIKLIESRSNKGYIQNLFSLRDAFIFYLVAVGVLGTLLLVEVWYLFLTFRRGERTGPRSVRVPSSR